MILCVCLSLSLLTLLVELLVCGPIGLEALLRTEVTPGEELRVTDLDTGGTLLLRRLPTVLSAAHLPLNTIAHLSSERFQILRGM